MTGDRYRLDYSLTPTQMSQMYEFMAGRSLKQKSKIEFFLSSPWIMIILGIYITISSYDGYVAIIDHVQQTGALPSLGIGPILSLAFGLFVVYWAAKSLWTLVTRRTAGRTGKHHFVEGFHWGEERLTVTESGLHIEGANFNTDYKWAAFQELIETKDLLLLQTTPRSAVVVPRKAFATQFEEEDFCAFVRQQVA